MKRIKLALSAFAILAVVGGALAFKSKAFVAGNIYCSATVPLTTETCAQQFSSAADFQTALSGSTTNPCPQLPVVENPYYTSGSSCIALGSTPWVATQE